MRLFAGIDACRSVSFQGTTFVSALSPHMAGWHLLDCCLSCLMRAQIVYKQWHPNVSVLFADVRPRLCDWSKVHAVPQHCVCPKVKPQKLGNCQVALGRCAEQTSALELMYCDAPNLRRCLWPLTRFSGLKKGLAVLLHIVVQHCQRCT
jgi:hypothetical protein